MREGGGGGKLRERVTERMKINVEGVRRWKEGGKK